VAAAQPLVQMAVQTRVHTDWRSFGCAFLVSVQWRRGAKGLAHGIGAALTRGSGAGSAADRAGWG